MIEQAKGILMARHAIDADRAFEMLRDHSQHNGHKLVDIAQAIVDSHLLLLPPIPQPAAPSHAPRAQARDAASVLPFTPAAPQQPTPRITAGRGNLPRQVHPQQSGLEQLPGRP